MFVISVLGINFTFEIKVNSLLSISFNENVFDIKIIIKFKKILIMFILNNIFFSFRLFIFLVFFMFRIYYVELFFTLKKTV